MRSKTEN